MLTVSSSAAPPWNRRATSSSPPRITMSERMLGRFSARLRTCSMVEASRPIFAGAVSPVSCDDVLLASWAAPQPVDVKVRAAKAPYTERINFHLICELLLQTVRRSIFAQMNGLGFGQGSNSNLWPTECSDELLYRRGETAPHRDAKLGTLIIAPDKKTRLSSKTPSARDRRTKERNTAWPQASW